MGNFFTSTNYEVEYNSCSNTVLYKGLAQKNFKPPNVPTYIDNKGVVQENPFSQKYADALVVYQKTIELAMVDVVLTNCIKFNHAWKKSEDWANCCHIMQTQSVLSNNNLELSFLKYYVLPDTRDHSMLAQEAFLTETRVYDIFGTVHIQREGVDIHKAYLKNTIDTGIEVQPLFIGIHQLVNPLDEFNACISGNMSWSKWYNCEYSLDEKASVVALSRLNRIRDIHSDDAVQIESERLSKRNNSNSNN